MKIKQRTQTTISSKQLKKTNVSQSFSSLLATHEPKMLEQTTEPADEPKQMSEHTGQQQPLEKVLNELEDIMCNLEEGSHNHKRAQMAIHSLRDALHDMPESFPLDERDREEAKTLLIIESKRIDELRKYEA